MASTGQLLRECQSKAFHFFDGGVKGCQKCEDICYDNGRDPECKENCKEYLVMKEILERIESATETLNLESNFIDDVSNKVNMLMIAVGVLLVLVLMLSTLTALKFGILKKCKRKSSKHYANIDACESVNGDYENVQPSANIADKVEEEKLPLVKVGPLPRLPSSSLSHLHDHEQPQKSKAPNVVGASAGVDVRLSQADVFFGDEELNPKSVVAKPSKIVDRALSVVGTADVAVGDKESQACSAVHKPHKNVNRTLSVFGTREKLSEKLQRNGSDGSIQDSDIVTANNGLGASSIISNGTRDAITGSRSHESHQSLTSKAHPTENKTNSDPSAVRSDVSDRLPGFYNEASASTSRSSENQYLPLVQGPNIDVSLRHVPRSIRMNSTYATSAQESQVVDESGSSFGMCATSEDDSPEQSRRLSFPQSSDFASARKTLGMEAIEHLTKYAYVKDVAMNQKGEVLLLVPRSQLVNDAQECRLYVKNHLRREALIFPVPD